MQHTPCTKGQKRRINAKAGEGKVRVERLERLVVRRGARRKHGPECPLRLLQPLHVGRSAHGRGGTRSSPHPLSARASARRRPALPPDGAPAARGRPGVERQTAQVGVELRDARHCRFV